MGMNFGRPFGTWLICDLLPTLKRWAIVVRSLRDGTPDVYPIVGRPRRDVRRAVGVTDAWSNLPSGLTNRNDSVARPASGLTQNLLHHAALFVVGEALFLAVVVVNEFRVVEAGEV